MTSTPDTNDKHGARDPRVDAYIARSAAFAQPLLQQLRRDVHASRTDVAESTAADISETIKWGMPFFMHAGKPLAHMAAFKQHCAFGFWRGKKVVGDAGVDGAMGQFGRLTQLADLPSSAAIQGLVAKAIALRDAGELAPAKAPQNKAKRK